MPIGKGPQLKALQSGKPLIVGMSTSVPVVVMSIQL